MSYSLRVLEAAIIVSACVAMCAVAAPQGKPAAEAKSPPPAASAPTAGTKSKVEIPTAVKRAFETAYPKAKIKKVSREKGGGGIRYEVESMDGTQARDLIYRKDGTVVEIEETIPHADLPHPVQQAIAAKYPTGKILKAEKLTRGTAILYEIRVLVGKKRHEVTFDPGGAQVTPKRKMPKKAPGK